MPLIGHAARENLLQPIRSTTQTWVVTRHQYGISALVSQTSFRGETVNCVAKCRLFSQATAVKKTVTVVVNLIYHSTLKTKYSLFSIK